MFSLACVLIVVLVWHFPSLDPRLFLFGLKNYTIRDSEGIRLSWVDQFYLLIFHSTDTHIYVFPLTLVLSVVQNKKFDVDNVSNESIPESFIPLPHFFRSRRVSPLLTSSLILIYYDLNTLSRCHIMCVHFVSLTDFIVHHSFIVTFSSMTLDFFYSPVIKSSILLYLSSLETVRFSPPQVWRSRDWLTPLDQCWLTSISTEDVIETTGGTESFAGVLENITGSPRFQKFRINGIEDVGKGRGSGVGVLSQENTYINQVRSPRSFVSHTQKSYTCCHMYRNPRDSISLFESIVTSKYQSEGGGIYPYN